jgi:hypothetical protein
MTPHISVVHAADLRTEMCRYRATRRSHDTGHFSKPTEARAGVSAFFVACVSEDQRAVIRASHVCRQIMHSRRLLSPPARIPAPLRYQRYPRCDPRIPLINREPRQLFRRPAANPERDSWEGKAMVGNMIRALRARMTLLAVDEAGMSTVGYSIVEDYTECINHS